MPTSKKRRKKLPHRYVAPTPPAAHLPAAPHPGPSRVRAWVGWSMVAVGTLSFLLGNIGVRTGAAIALPFDPHHVFAQFGGGLVAIVGLIIATGGT